MFRTALIGLAAALASGCVSTGIYPDEWAERTHVTGGGCPAVSGSYENVGEQFYRTAGHIARREIGLFDELGEYAIGSVAGEFASIRLDLVEGALKVTGIREDGSTAGFERPVEGCSGSMVNVVTDWKHSVEEPGGAELLGMTLLMVHWFERTATKLARAADGSLLVRKSEAGSLMLYWMPVLPGGQSEWIRFPPATGAPARVARAAEE